MVNVKEQIEKCNKCHHQVIQFDEDGIEESGCGADIKEWRECLGIGIGNVRLGNSTKNIKFEKRKAELLDGQLCGKDIPCKCGMCQFFYEIRLETGLGVCFQKMELREDCDAGDLVEETCSSLIQQSHKCLSCDHQFPTCSGEPKFLIQHPKVEGHDNWIIQRHRDIIYECNQFKITKFYNLTPIQRRLVY